MIPVLVAAVVVGGIAFFAGMKFQQSKQPGFFRQGGMRGGNASGAQGAGIRNGFRPVNGEISSVSGTTMTVKMPNGESRIVVLSESTEISKADAATKNDLTTGAKVAVFGTQNADGSVTAQNIQLNPLMRAFTGPSGK